MGLFMSTIITIGMANMKKICPAIGLIEKRVL